MQTLGPPPQTCCGGVPAVSVLANSVGEADVPKSLKRCCGDLKNDQKGEKGFKDIVTEQTWGGGNDILLLNGPTFVLWGSPMPY